MFSPRQNNKKQLGKQLNRAIPKLFGIVVPGNATETIGCQKENVMRI